MKGHVNETYSSRKPRHLANLVGQRGRGVPLQYVLGSQPFGPLDIICKPGVLIPRPETEAYTYYLAYLIKSEGLLGSRTELKQNGLKIVDFCTGTGCIPLSLFSSLQPLVESLTVQGIDISPTAIQLAKENVDHNIKLGNTRKPTAEKTIRITKADVFSQRDIQSLANSRWDLLISNPPYISQDVWNHGRGQLGLSVRKYEPRLALIPDGNLPRPAWCDAADVFYSRLLDISALLGPKVMLFEIGDESQARRVLQLYFRHEVASLARVELWRDWPDSEPAQDEKSQIEVATRDGDKQVVSVRGSGLLRCVFIQR